MQQNGPTVLRLGFVRLKYFLINENKVESNQKRGKVNCFIQYHHHLKHCQPFLLHR